MSKKKAKRDSERGTYALCMTTGLIVGFGLGPVIGNIIFPAIFGLFSGAAVGYLLNHRKSGHKR